MRAKRYIFEYDRKRFVVRRGILRALLGSYLGISPEQVRFTYGKNQKPELTGTSDADKIHFNISHSEGLAVFAFSNNSEIGVDIEYIRDVPEMDRIIDRLFSEREKSILDSLYGKEKNQAFFNCWTRKEAYIKALGEGLSYPLDSFDVSLVPDHPAKILGIKESEESASQWELVDLKITAGYTAVVAVKSKVVRVLSRKWSANYDERPDIIDFAGEKCRVS
jgi:4'-phosphopantetheinyl transferase